MSFNFDKISCIIWTILTAMQLAVWITVPNYGPQFFLTALISVLYYRLYTETGGKSES